MARISILLAALLGLAVLFCLTVPAQATPGLPGSPEFGYGARLEIDGPQVEDALEMAADLPLDWMAVTVRWDNLASDPAGSGAWQSLDRVMQFAGKNDISIMISLTAAPALWVTTQGPEPARTAQFVGLLASRYAGTLKAVELFPGANTRRGWGTVPNPAAYAQMYEAAQAQLQSTGSPVMLVAAGLNPVVLQASGDMDDLQFLRQLYSNSTLTMPVISLVFSDLTGEPAAPVASGEHRVLRHYEEVRQVMTDTGHAKDLIWITAIRAPSGTINLTDQKYQDPNEQTRWLLQAYHQLRSQLSIGVIYYQSLNRSTSPFSPGALILDDQQYHPFYGILRELVLQNSSGSSRPIHGRPKSEALDKHRP